MGSLFVRWCTFVSELLTDSRLRQGVETRGGGAEPTRPRTRREERRSLLQKSRDPFFILVFIYIRSLSRKKKEKEKC